MPFNSGMQGEKATFGRPLSLDMAKRFAENLLDQNPRDQEFEVAMVSAQEARLLAATMRTLGHNASIIEDGTRVQVRRMHE